VFANNDETVINRIEVIRRVMGMDMNYRFIIINMGKIKINDL